MPAGLILAVPLLVSSSVTTGARSITLEEALQRAAESSPVGREIALDIERARAGIEASGLWANPDLSLTREESAGVERFATLSQSFPLTGRLSLERDAARTGLAAAEARARQDRLVLRAQVHGAFVDLLLAQDSAGILDEGRDRFRELVEALRHREREGESSGFDRMRAERELAEVDADRAEAFGRLGGARGDLAALVDLPPEGLQALGDLSPLAPLPPFEEVRRSAAGRGDLGAIDLEAERAGLQARAAKRRRVPDPSITVGMKSTGDGPGEDRGPVLGIGLSLPVFDRGQGARGVQEAERALLLARRVARGRLVEAEVEAAYAEAAARREAEAAFAAAGTPDELVRIARAGYDAGTMRILELLDAYRTALDARLREAQLRAAARRADAALAAAMGVER